MMHCSNKNMLVMFRLKMYQGYCKVFVKLNVSLSLFTTYIIYKKKKQIFLLIALAIIFYREIKNR